MAIFFGMVSNNTKTSINAYRHTFYAIYMQRSCIKVIYLLLASLKYCLALFFIC